MHRFGNAVHDEPCATRHHRIAFNPVVLREVDRDLPARVDPAAAIAAGFKQRQDIGKWVHQAILNDCEYFMDFSE